MHAVPQGRRDFPPLPPSPPNPGTATKARSNDSSLEWGSKIVVLRLATAPPSMVSLTELHHISWHPIAPRPIRSPVTNLQTKTFTASPPINAAVLRREQ